MGEKFVSLKNVNKYYDNGMHAVVDFNLDIDQNEFIVFVGPSGCGKSTTLRMIAGLEDISGGELYIEGRLANDLEPVDRDVSMVFQSYALYPNMTIYDNIAFPLQVHGKPTPKLEVKDAEAFKAEESKIREEFKQKEESGVSELKANKASKEEIRNFVANLKNECFERVEEARAKYSEQVMTYDHDKVARLKLAIKEIPNDDPEKENKVNELNAEIEKVKQTLDTPAMTMKPYKREEIDKRVREAATILEIADQLQKKPKALSGGQRQRVALGRAIVRESKILLMDEPLSNLDAKLRVYMRSEIVRLHEKMNATTIYVTHDQTEAMTMASRIVVMNKGYVQQIGTPEEIYKHPANMFVASFIGSPAMNFVEAKLESGELSFSDGHKMKLDASKEKEVKEFYTKLLKEWQEEYPGLVEARKAQTEREFKAKKLRLGKKFEFSEEEDPILKQNREAQAKVEELLKGKEYNLIFGIRPESIKEDKKGEKFIVEFTELLGDEYYIHFFFGGKKCLAKIPAERKINKGDDIYLSFQEDKLHLFDPISNRAIF